jgi:FkbM family methyltransferase
MKLRAASLELLRGGLWRWYLVRARHPLKDKIVGHWWSWFARRPYWVKYDADLTIKLSLRDCLQSTIFFEGSYESTIVDWLRHELRPDDVFWDVGANIGAITLIAARHCASVVSFEPAPATFANLEENVRANGLSNVRLKQIALSNRDGEAILSLGPDCNSGMNSIALHRSDQPGVTVCTARADSLLAAGALPAPTVMKIDVEGAEAAVFAGLTSSLASPRLRAIVFESRKGADGSPAEAVISLLLNAAGFSIRELGGSPHLENDGLVNYLASR